MEYIYKCAPNFYLICIEHFKLNQIDDNQEQKMVRLLTHLEGSGLSLQEGVGSSSQLEGDDSYHSPLVGYYYQLNERTNIYIQNLTILYIISPSNISLDNDQITY